MASLADIDRVLALFAEGIAGRPVHIKSASEFAGEPSAEVRHGVNEVAGVNGIDGIDARHDAKSVYLPDRIEHFADDELNSALYRVAVLDELGFREFGSYRFDMETARQRMPGLASRESSVIGLRESDLGIFFHSFEHPALARSLFRIIETARIRAAVERRYPGTRRYRHALREHLEGIWTLPAGAIATELAMLRAALLGLAAASRLYPFAVAVLTPDADVYTTAAATATCLEALAPESVDALPDDSGTDGDPTMEWLQREARLDNWDEELANLDGEIAAMEFAESAQLEQIKAGNASRDAGDLRDAGAALVVERDQLKRRIDMERSSVRRALGDEHKHTASYRYDEWDYHNGVYLRAWCRLYEERLQPEEAKDTGALLAVVRPYVRAARRQFEQVRPTGYQRVKKTPDGDELDLDAIVATRADLRVGASPDERVYSRRERLRRDVGAVLLVDLSASTDDIIPDASASRSPHDSAGAKSSLGGPRASAGASAGESAGHARSLLRRTRGV